MKSKIGPIQSSEIGLSSLFSLILISATDLTTSKRRCYRSRSQKKVKSTRMGIRKESDKKKEPAEREDDPRVLEGRSDCRSVAGRFSRINS